MELLKIKYNFKFIASTYIKRIIKPNWKYKSIINNKIKVRYDMLVWGCFQIFSVFPLAPFHLYPIWSNGGNFIWNLLNGSIFWINT